VPKWGQLRVPNPAAGAASPAGAAGRSAPGSKVRCSTPTAIIPQRGVPASPGLSLFGMPCSTPEDGRLTALIGWVEHDAQHVDAARTTPQDPSRSQTWSTRSSPPWTSARNTAGTRLMRRQRHPEVLKARRQAKSPLTNTGTLRPHAPPHQGYELAGERLGPRLTRPGFRTESVSDRQSALRP
jgi:hypothetical protein